LLVVVVVVVEDMTLYAPLVVAVLVASVLRQGFLLLLEQLTLFQ
jgi:hypothetical protein